MSDDATRRKAIALTLATALAVPAEGLRQYAYKDPVGLPTMCFGSTAGVRMGDFMASLPAEDAPFDRILMNPPFHRGADAAHIGHALDFLAPGGRLVAIASGAFSGRATKATKVVRDRIEAWGGQIDSLPEGSFKEAGTSVATVLITVDRPRSAS